MSTHIRSKIALTFAISLVAFATATYADTVRGQTGDQIPLPAVTEFRDGDVWDAYDAAATQAMTENAQSSSLKFASIVASVSVERQAGHWAIHHDSVESWAQEGAPTSRHFSDLRLKPAKYPADAAEGAFFATPDGLLHRFVDGQWIDVAIGQTVPNPHGSSMLVTERITPHEAEDITTYFSEPPTSAPVGRPTVTPPSPNHLPKTQPSDPTGFVAALCLGATAFITTIFNRRQRKKSAPSLGFDNTRLRS